METKANAILLVDQQFRDADARLCHQRINPVMEAYHFKQLAYAICSNVWSIAIVSEHDSIGFQAYSKAGYDVIRVNGNRPRKLKDIMAEIKRWAMSMPSAEIVFVTTDEDLLEQTKPIPQRHIKLHIWAPEHLLSKAYKNTPYNFRNLDKLIRPNARVGMYLDYENLHVALERMGIHPDPKRLLGVIQETVNDLGDIASINAYADWGQLEKHSHMDVQRSLAFLGVETYYLISRHGKNSADMRIARDLYLTMERDSADIIVLVSGDRDFRDVVKALQESGKKIVLLGFQSTMNGEIAAMAHHVRFLDSALKTPIRSTGQKEKGVQTQDQNLNILRAIKLFDHNNYAAVDQTSLIQSLGIIDVQELIRSDILILASTSGKETFTLNYKKLEVEQIIYLSQWVLERIETALQKMPWVDTNYLSKGMQMDTKLRDWQLGQTRPSVEYWLGLLEVSGTIVRIKQSHPNNPERIINTWWTPRKALALQDSSKALLAGHQNTVSRVSP